KAKILSAMRATTPGQFFDFDRPAATPVFAPKGAIPPPIPGGVPAFPPGKEFDLPKKDAPPLPSAVPSKGKREKSQESFFEAADEPDPVTAPDRFPRPKPDLNARHYILERQGMHLFIVDERTLLFAGDNDRGDEVLVALTAQLLRRSNAGPLDRALTEAL